MKTNIIQLIGALALLLGISINPVIAQVAIIINHENTASFTDKQIENIFLIKINQFPDGKKARIVMPVNEMEVVQEFAQKACNRKIFQLQATWKQMLFTGKGSPVNVDNDDDVIKEVSANPEYIGIIDAAKVTDKVKVVKVY